MDSQQELAKVRRAYARRLMALAGIANPGIEEAFATVERERYLGPGPWPILCPAGYVATPDDDPARVYADVLIGIIPERGLNNGMPSYHVPLLASAGIRAGDHVVHIGAGVGYYTAIMACLAGPAGRVTGIEFDAGLAARAATNLSNVGNVQVLQGDGFSMPFDPADVIYVNAGVTHPADIWLDRLNDGGRLILPLTTENIWPPARGAAVSPAMSHYGVVFRIERAGDEYLAAWVSAVALYPCEGGRDDASEARLAAAFQKGGWRRVTRLYRTGDLPDERCWLRGARWALAYG
ncbi:methyltransferase domain-containing protein [Paraburkholderia fungorum]|jgi:protein-L-isoaspartate(D-aspartate) O-methyltransferase|uniref:Protein-L-isoaspartate O-methyltransferase n=1 Tax=Paraburkholderia fungorum TaxID=134537 RepID=A0AAP5V0E9_9BURK|nr:methyltransferase domain-containing protein [Paraburkholderia fungorum]MDT8842892.1 methyltransferase domain-containing protein [Paraburkholderia fungorum]PRZ46105.1 protein-L-isoaspartate(D-aspartate) O-methyltransferase [Paraburkholderia fungorum]